MQKNTEKYLHPLIKFISQQNLGSDSDISPEQPSLCRRPRLAVYVHVYIGKGL